MRLFIFPEDKRQPVEKLDMQAEQFEAFLQDHNVVVKKTSVAKGGEILLWYKDTTYRLLNLPPRVEWQHLIKGPTDYPEGSTIRILLERKADRKAAQQRFDAARKALQQRQRGAQDDCP
jgi:hypothetical protein